MTDDKSKALNLLFGAGLMAPGVAAAIHVALFPAAPPASVTGAIDAVVWGMGAASAPILIVAGARLLWRALVE